MRRGQEQFLGLPGSTGKWLAQLVLHRWLLRVTEGAAGLMQWVGWAAPLLGLRRPPLTLLSPHPHNPHLGMVEKGGAADQEEN